MEQPDSLIDYAYIEIKNRIQNGSYSPGTKLSTQDISDQLGISRTPVVAAINRLVAQGLADAIPRRGTIVSKLSIQQIKNIIEVRKMIELFAIKSIIRNVDFFPETIQKMQSIIIQFENASSSNYSIAAELENNFHSLFVSLTGNEQLVKIYESNWSVGAIFYLYGIAKLPLSVHEKAFNQHKNILNFILAKDEEGLRSAIEDHLKIVDDSFEWYCMNVGN